MVKIQVYYYLTLYKVEQSKICNDIYCDHKIILGIG